MIIQPYFCFPCVGRRRLLRLLQRLQATDVQRHAQLLLAATQRDAALAAAFLGSIPYTLDPSATTRWLASMTLTGQIVEHAANGALSFVPRVGWKGGGMKVLNENTV